MGASISSVSAAKRQERGLAEGLLQGLAEDCLVKDAAACSEVRICCMRDQMTRTHALVFKHPTCAFHVTGLTGPTSLPFK